MKYRVTPKGEFVSLLQDAGIKLEHACQIWDEYTKRMRLNLICLGNEVPAVILDGGGKLIKLNRDYPVFDHSRN